MSIYPPLSFAFSPPSPLRVDILVSLFFSVSFISSPASRTIPFSPWDALIIMIDSDYPSILKGKQGFKCCVFFLSCLLLHLKLLLTAGAIWTYKLFLSVPLIPAFFGVMFTASPISLKSINSSGGKLNFPWYNLLCYSPSAVYHSTSMYNLCSVLLISKFIVYFIMSLGGCRQQNYI